MNDSIGTVREYAGIADIDAGLTAEFGSEADRVEDRARRGLVGKIGLVEDVVAVGRVLIGAEVDGGIGRVDRAAERTVGRIDVLIEFLVVGGVSAVPDGQAVFEIMIELCQVKRELGPILESAGFIAMPV